MKGINFNLHRNSNLNRNIKVFALTAPQSPKSQNSSDIELGQNSSDTDETDKSEDLKNSMYE